MSSDTASKDGKALVVAPPDTLNDEMCRRLYVCLSTASAGLEYVRLRRRAFVVLQLEDQLVQALDPNDPEDMAELALIMQECTQLRHETRRYCEEFSKWVSFVRESSPGEAPRPDDEDTFRGKKLDYLTGGHLGLLAFFPPSAIATRDGRLETVLTPLDAVLNDRTMQWQERIAGAVSESWATPWLCAIGQVVLRQVLRHPLIPNEDVNDLLDALGHGTITEEAAWRVLGRFEVKRCRCEVPPNKRPASPLPDRAPEFHRFPDRVLDL